MKRSRTSLKLFGATAALFGMLQIAPAFAQDNYPSRPIRIIVPYTPGASTDAISRAFGDEAGKALGQTVIVENKPGAGTAIGTQTAKQAPADGYQAMRRGVSYRLRPLGACLRAGGTCRHSVSSLGSLVGKVPTGSP